MRVSLTLCAFALVATAAAATGAKSQPAEPPKLAPTPKLPAPKPECVPFLKLRQSYGETQTRGQKELEAHHDDAACEAFTAAIQIYGKMQPQIAACEGPASVKRTTTLHAIVTTLRDVACTVKTVPTPAK